MYSILLVSRDERLRELTGKFVPRIDRNIDIHFANGEEAALLALENGSTGFEAIVFDHTLDNNAVSFIDLVDRTKSEVPIIVVAQDTGPDLLEKLINTRIEKFMRRGGRELTEFFTELCNVIVITSEKHRSENEHRTNEIRMASMIKMAKMDHSNFQSIVEFALEKCIEITNSDIGYVSQFDKQKGIIRMLAWSNKAMKTCGVSNYPIEFELNSTGIWGEPIRLGKTVIVNDYGGDNRAMKKGTPMGHVKLQRLLMIPIYINGAIVGTAGLGNKPTEYTWNDEKQLKMMMEDLFEIHGKIESSKRQNFHMDLVTKFIEDGPMGIIFTDEELDVIMINEVAKYIIGAESMTNHFHLNELRTPQSDNIISCINSVRKTESSLNSRLLMTDNKMNMAFEVFVQMVKIERTRSGFMVLFNDISDLMQVDIDKVRMEDHVSVLEGPVLNSLLRTVDNIGTGITSQADLDRLQSIARFMDDYRLAGKNRETWMRFDSIMEKAARASALGDVELEVRSLGVEILADPAFPLVFKHLINNSIAHGGNVTKIEVKCKISRGNMTIAYSDNGKGVPDDVRERILDLVSEGKFGMFLIRTLVRASGMSIRCVPSKDGALFEIDVPPESFMLR